MEDGVYVQIYLDTQERARIKGARMGEENGIALEKKIQQSNHDSLSLSLQPDFSNENEEWKMRKEMREDENDERFRSISKEDFLRFHQMIPLDRHVVCLITRWNELRHDRSDNEGIIRTLNYRKRMYDTRPES